MHKHKALFILPYTNTHTHPQRFLGCVCIRDALARENLVKEKSASVGGSAIQCAKIVWILDKKFDKRRIDVLHFSFDANATQRGINNPGGVKSGKAGGAVGRRETMSPKNVFGTRAIRDANNGLRTMQRHSQTRTGRISRRKFEWRNTLLAYGNVWLKW